MSLLVPVVPIEKPPKITETTTNAAGGTSTTMKDAPVVLPDLPMAYLVGSTGVFQLIKNPFYRMVRKAAEIHGLAKLEEELEIFVTKLPEKLFREIEDFLVESWKRTDGESVVLLAYNPDLKEWKPLIPKQKVASSAVDYDMADTPIPDGFKLFGTVHSHPTFSAFHSGTDDRDEFQFDGLHITVGFVNRTTHEYAMRWIINGTARKIEHIETCVQLPERPAVKCDPAWLTRVEKRNTYTPPVNGTIVHGTQHGGYQGGHGGFGHHHGGVYGDNDFYYRNRDSRVNMDSKRDIPPPLDPAAKVKEEMEAWQQLGFSSGDAAAVHAQIVAICNDPTKASAFKKVVIMLWENPNHSLSPLQSQVLDALEDSKDEKVRTLMGEALSGSVYGAVDEDDTDLFEAASVHAGGTAFDSYQREATLGGKRGNRRSKNKIKVS